LLAVRLAPVREIRASPYGRARISVRFRRS